MNATAFREYLAELRANISRGDATEHTHRPALKALLESAYNGVTATNEPKRISDCGAPDMAVSAGSPANMFTIGYVEAKDIGVSLDAIERDSNRKNPSTTNGDQLKRYRDALPNLVLTNYAEFRWYADGELRGSATLADYDGVGLASVSDGQSRVRDLLAAFINRRPERVASPSDLARRMAQATHMLRDVIRESFAIGQASSNMLDLYKSLKETLVPDLTKNAFADMFAQTLAYGLFAARVNNDNSRNLQWQDAMRAIPSENPFLKQLFSIIAISDIYNEPYTNFVKDLWQLLINADMESVFADFGRRGARQDPMMHFYETFLEAYDPEIRERRGVYYTPEPVISYIVRSVDKLLRERFDCADGLADNDDADYEALEDADGETKPVKRKSHRVLVLDPACGTGSFLYAVIDHIRQWFIRSDNLGMWNAYARKHLLPRIFGFELMMAPYAMTHMKLGMQLAALDMPPAVAEKWAYKFTGEERLKVYLTNTLNPAQEQIQTLFGPYRIISAEANAADEVKRDLPIMVVLGNPPYSGHSSNKGEWITDLVNDYKMVDGKPLGERNPKWLQDDYVKFIRFGQWRIQKSGAGVLAFITNHSYLDNPTFRGMRQQLMDTFTHIYLLDLHGNALKKERAPDGGVDQNVFDIRQGVSIALFVKEPNKSGPAIVRHADLYGTRADKYKALAESDIANTDWELLRPKQPNYLFKPWDNELGDEYERYTKITDAMPLNSSGMVTGRDKLTIRHSRKDAIKVARDFASLPVEVARSKYDLGNDTQAWKVHLAQDDLQKSGLKENLVQPILYRLFDTRYTYYTGGHGFICGSRPKVMRHMLASDNLALITCRQQSQAGDEWAHCSATNSMIEGCTISNKTKEINYLFPLYAYPPEQGIQASGERVANLSPAFVSDMERRLGMEFAKDGAGDMQSDFGPEDAFHYIYAMFHSPAYRKRYAQFLRADFPRVPMTDDVGLFRALAGLGRRLTDAHLLRKSALTVRVRFPVPGDGVVEKGHPQYCAPGDEPPSGGAPLERGRVYISKPNRRRGSEGQYFDGIAPDAWEFRIGGYRPLDKWLRDRKERKLDFDDIDHYRSIAAAIEATMSAMADIDAAIAASGGPFPVD